MGVQLTQKPGSQQKLIATASEASAAKILHNNGGNGFLPLRNRLGAWKKLEKLYRVKFPAGVIRKTRV